MSSEFERLMSRPHFTGPKRQHFVPEFYLQNGFTRDGFVYVLDRKTGKVERQTPKNTAVIGHYYTFEDEQGRKRYDLEVLFAYIEDKAAPIIKGLVAGERLRFEDADMLATYLALSVVRTPSAVAEAQAVEAQVRKAQFAAELSDEGEALRRVREWNTAEGGGAKTEADLKRLASGISKMVREDSYRIVVSHERGRQHALKLMHVIAHELYKRDWCVVRPEHEDDRFITTDAPVVLTTTSLAARDLPLGYGSPHGQILFALGDRCALVLSGTQQRFGRAALSRKDARRFNLTLAANSHRYCYASAPEVLEFVEAELQLSKEVWQPRVDVGTVERDGGRFAYIRGGVR